MKNFNNMEVHQFLGEESHKKNNIQGELLKKGAWTIRSRLGKKEGRDCF